MTTLPGLRGQSHLQSNYSAVECYRRQQMTDARQRNNTVVPPTLCVGGAVINV